MQNAQNVSNARPGAAGAIFSLPPGATAPTDAVTALAQDVINYGYASDDGLSNSFDISNESFNAWGGDNVLTVRTSYEETFGFSLIETNENGMRAVHGEDNVIVTESGMTVFHTSQDLEYRTWIFEILLTGNRVKRIVVPDGKITDREDVNYQDGELVMYGVTLATRPVEVEIGGETKRGVTAIEYIAKIESGGSGNQ